MVNNISETSNNQVVDTKNNSNSTKLLDPAGKFLPHIQHVAAAMTETASSDAGSPHDSQPQPITNPLDEVHNRPGPSATDEGKRRWIEDPQDRIRKMQKEMDDAVRNTSR